MTDEELESVGITRFGDRIALRVFCRQALVGKDHSQAAHCSESSGQGALIARLKAKLDKKQLKTSSKALALVGNTNAKKVTRRLELGWLNFDATSGQYKQVRYKRGGGTRKVSTDCNDTMDHLLTMAKGLFFRDGVSVEGRQEDFEFGMGGFDGCAIDLNVTVEEVYSRSMAKMLRLYMMTKSVDLVAGTHCDVEESSGSPPQKLLILDSSTIAQPPDGDKQNSELPDLLDRDVRVS